MANEILNVLKCQHNHIVTVFPFYDRTKSEVIAEAGSDCTEYYKGSFIVKIFRKGVFRFDTDKDSTQYKRIK